MWFKYLKSKLALLKNSASSRSPSPLSNNLNPNNSNNSDTQAALSVCEARLKQQEKMAAIGLLTAGIAHEIKNPLNFINNFSKLDIELLSELKAEIEKLTIPAQSKELINMSYLM